MSRESIEIGLLGAVPGGGSPLDDAGVELEAGSKPLGKCIRQPDAGGSLDQRPFTQKAGHAPGICSQALQLRVLVFPLLASSLLRFFAQRKS